MATIRINSGLNKKITSLIDSTLKQHQAWLIYSIFAPLLTGFAGLLFYLSTLTSKEELLYIYLSLAAITSTAWWLWTMLVIYKMYIAQRHVLEMTSELLGEIKQIKTSVLEDRVLTSSK